MVFQNLGPLKELVLPRGMTSSKLRYITYTIGNAVRGVRTRFPHPRDHPRRVDKKLVQNDIIKIGKIRNISFLQFHTIGIQKESSGSK